MPVPPKSKAKPAISPGAPKAPRAPDPRENVAGSVVVSDANYLRAKPKPRFFLVHYPRDPGNWHIYHGDDGPVLTPRLQQHALIPGVGGIATKQVSYKPHADPALDAVTVTAIAKIARLGGTALIRSRVHHGQDLTHEYLRCWEAVDPARDLPPYEHWCAVWQTPRHGDGRGGLRTTKYDVDLDAMAVYALDLIDRGELDAPGPHVLKHFEAKFGHRVARQRDQLEMTRPGLLASAGLFTSNDIEEASDATVQPLGRGMVAAVAGLQAVRAAAVPTSPRVTVGPAPREANSDA